jgi:hypothetical protein
MTARKILTAALGLPETATDDQMAAKLADIMAPKFEASMALSVDPEMEFHRLASQMSATMGISLADSYSLVSRECPTLHERYAARARMN